MTIANDSGGDPTAANRIYTGRAADLVVTNGNFIITPESAMGLARHINQYFAWDCAISPYVRNHWHITGLIRNDFEGKNATEELLRTPETGDVAPVMVHGYKDRSAQVIARKWMNL